MSEQEHADEQAATLRDEIQTIESQNEPSAESTDSE